MGDIHFSMFATPGTHKDLEVQINGWEYPVEGAIVKGTQKPVLIKHQHYSVRLQDSIKEQFVRDMGLSSTFGKYKSRIGWMEQLYIKLINIFVKLGPFKPIIPNKDLPQKYKLHTWSYKFCFGEIKRKPVEVKTGGYREAL